MPDSIVISGKTYTAKILKDGFYSVKTCLQAETIDSKRAQVAKKLGLAPPQYPRPPLPKAFAEMTTEDWTSYAEACKVWATPEKVQKWEKETEEYKAQSDPTNAKLWEEHERLWLEYLRCQFVEDVADLATDKITEGEQLDLINFTWTLLVRTRQKQVSGNGSLKSIKQPEVSGDNSPIGSEATIS